MSPLPGTSVLCLSVALEPDLLLLALLRLAVGLAWRVVEVQCLAVWCCLVSILFVCVFGLISVLTDVEDGKWRLMCSVLLRPKGCFTLVSAACEQYSKWIKLESFCSWLHCVSFFLSLKRRGLDAVWATDPSRSTEADLLDPAPALAFYIFLLGGIIVIVKWLKIPSPLDSLMSQCILLMLRGPMLNPGIIVQYYEKNVKQMCLTNLADAVLHNKFGDKSAEVIQ